MTDHVVVIGGGPGGYEAALVAAQLGAQVTVVDSDGLGGACVLTDCVPSKTLIATSTTMSVLHGAEDLGIRAGGRPGWGRGSVDAPRLYARVKALAKAQSADVALRLAAEGVQIVSGRGALAGPGAVLAGGGRVGAGRHGRAAPGAARRGTGRGAHPDLAAAVRPARAARRADRGRLRGD